MTMFTRTARIGFFVGVVGVAFLAAGFAFGPVNADDQPSTAFSPEQQKALERTIQDFILRHPELIVESVQKFQEKQEQEARLQAQAAVAHAGDELNSDPTSPVAGNVNGDVTVVEFFDYRCGYCKRVFPSIQELLKKDGNIRYVFKEYPILGDDSVVASKASLAVWAKHPEKYMDVHSALITARGKLDEDRVMKLIQKTGLDPDEIRAAMADPSIEAVLRKNFELGHRLGINGTPAFIIGGQLVPGAISLDQLEKLVATARAS